MEPTGTSDMDGQVERPSERERASQTPYNSQQRLVAQFDVPVREINEVFPEIVLLREINEVFPEIVLGRSKSDLDKRPPLRSLRFADQAHVCFTWKLVALARVAWDAGANHVFPSGRPAPVAWRDVIQIEVTPVENLAAILAGVLVPLEYVVACEFDLFLWKPIEHQQDDDPRDTNLERNRGDRLMIRRARRQIAPAFEIVR